MSVWLSRHQEQFKNSLFVCLFVCLLSSLFSFSFLLLIETVSIIFKHVIHPITPILKHLVTFSTFKIIPILWPHYTQSHKFFKTPSFLPSSYFFCMFQMWFSRSSLVMKNSPQLAHFKSFFTCSYFLCIFRIWFC